MTTSAVMKKNRVLVLQRALRKCVNSPQQVHEPDRVPGGPPPLMPALDHIDSYVLNEAGIAFML